MSKLHLSVSYSLGSSMLKYTSLVLTFLSVLCEGQRQDLIKLRFQLEELDRKLLDASRATGLFAARIVGYIMIEFKNECKNADILHTSKNILHDLEQYLDKTNNYINQEISLLEGVLRKIYKWDYEEQEAERLVRQFPKYKKWIENKVASLIEKAEHEYDKLFSLLKTC